ncbi:MAG: nucleotidyltransferase family protein [Gammaproteobacteria bacterium]
MTKITGILLAAGASRRFGRPKLVEPLANGEPLGVFAAKNLTGLLSSTLVVVSDQDNALVSRYRQLGLEVVTNEAADEGMAASLVKGIQSSPESDAWIIALADMPWVKPETIGSIKNRLEGGASMVAPLYQGKRGHPVGFSSQWKTALLNLQGDKGGRELLRKYADQVSLIDTDDEGILLDVDYPQDLK